jgi:hypothetical protein
VPNPDTKTQLDVTVNIRHGPVSPAQKAAWRELFAKLLSKAAAGQGEGNGSEAAK